MAAFFTTDARITRIPVPLSMPTVSGYGFIPTVPSLAFGFAPALTRFRCLLAPSRVNRVGSGHVDDAG